MTNFEFFKNRCNLRSERGPSDVWLFVAYLFLNSGNLLVIRNDIDRLLEYSEGDEDSDVLYFEGVWEDRYNLEYNNQSLDTNSKLSDYVKPNEHGEGCHCDSHDSLDNGFFYINSDSDLQGMSGYNNFDGGLSVFRLIGIIGIHRCYEIKYQNILSSLQSQGLDPESDIDQYNLYINDLNVWINNLINSLYYEIVHDYEILMIGTQGPGGGVPLRRIEGSLKDRYELFLYEWRQSVIEFRKKFNVPWSYNV